MSYQALVNHFAEVNDLPIPVDEVIGWIKQNTDHKIIKKAFRGACRRTAITTGGVYSAEHEIITEILYGDDLPIEWKRLVIAKEALHVFDPQGALVNTPEAVERLIPAVITRDLFGEEFAPAFDDHMGAFRAMAVLLPRAARTKLAAATAENRTTEEIARYAQLPAVYVDLWLRFGEQIENALVR